MLDRRWEAGRRPTQRDVNEGPARQAPNYGQMQTGAEPPVVPSGCDEDSQTASVCPRKAHRSYSGQKRFNVILIMTDQHNHAVLGAAGNPVVETPVLDRLAEQGARFSHAVCATPICSPARASLLTGFWPHTHGITSNVNANRPEQREITDADTLIEQVLFDHGYKTFHIGKWHLGDKLDLRCYRGQQHLTRETYESEKGWEDFIHSTAEVKWDKPREGEIAEREVAYTPEMWEFHQKWTREKRRSLQDLSKIGRCLIPFEHTYEYWMTKRCVELIHQHRHENFMITWSASPPHPLWIAPEPFYSMYNPIDVPFPASWDDRPLRYQASQAARLGKKMGEKRVREYLRCYYAQVSMIDWCIGRILQTLAEDGLEEDTLVLFVSDHGDMQGAHGMVGKSVPAYYDEIVRVPLIIRYPRAIEAGSVINTHVNATDIFPTILDYAGIPYESGQGETLRPLIEGTQADDRPGFCERGEQKQNISRMIRTESWKYAVYGNGYKELFCLRDDPYETNNLADSTSYRSVLTELQEQLYEHMRVTRDPATRLEAFLPST